MGGQGAHCELLSSIRGDFPVAAAISPAIDYHLRMDEGDETLSLMYEDREAARQDTATLHVHPLNWPRHVWFCCDPLDVRWHEGAERLPMKMAALGIPFQCDLETSGGGHDFNTTTTERPRRSDSSVRDWNWSGCELRSAWYPIAAAPIDREPCG